jgi:Zn-dependent alcohol dehydrogenase
VPNCGHCHSCESGHPHLCDEHGRTAGKLFDGNRAYDDIETDGVGRGVLVP